MYEALVARVRYHIQKAEFMGLKEAESTLLLKDASIAIEQLEAQFPRWIPVSERLPEEYVNVLCHLRSLDGELRYYSIDHLMEDGQWWKASTSWRYVVTHWMPLPEPPEEE